MIDILDLICLVAATPTLIIIGPVFALGMWLGYYIRKKTHV